MPTKYIRVKRVDGKRLILRDPSNINFLGVACVTGIEVNAHGDEVASGAADERQHIIQLTMIKNVTQMRWNLKYATLEPL